MDKDFEDEKEWLEAKLQEERAEEDAKLAEGVNEQEYEDCGDGIECGCCFDTKPFVSRLVLLFLLLV